MENKVLSSTSIFFHLATAYGPMEACYPREDICSYVRAVIGGALMVLLLSLLGGLVTVITISQPLAWALYNLLHDVYVPMENDGKLSLIMDLIIIVTTSFFYAKHVYGRRIARYFHREQPVKGPTFLSEAYRSFKYKTCVPVRFEGIDELY